MRIAIAALTLSCLLPLTAWAQQTTPVGRWRSIDDATGKPKAVIDIQAAGNGTLSARIVQLADVYDALVNERVYKRAWTPAEAAKVIRDGRGRLFEPDVVDAFTDLHDRGQWQRLAANGHGPAVDAPAPAAAPAPPTGAPGGSVETAR